MAETAYARRLALPDSEVSNPPRHSVLVRVTHWLTAIGFFGLLVSGAAVLLAHPRLYWGETGGVGGPSLVDLPLPFVLKVPIRGPGRYLHFLSAWVCVLTGLAYVVSGAFTRHFGKNLLPAKTDLAWRSIWTVMSNHLHFRRPTQEEEQTYNVLQRMTYLTVIFVLFPLAIWTGLAMSPAVTSVFPAIVNAFGGQQSARTIHFVLASLLVLFLVVHVVMVCLAGFTTRVRGMISGRVATRKERI